MMPRILFLGENWYGSCARACCYALRRLGCDVMDVDGQTFFPQLKRLSSRALVRLARSRLTLEYNDWILETASAFRPDILLAFKGAHVAARTLQILRPRGISLYNYYPDTTAFAYGSLLPESLPEYDCVFYTKRFWFQDTARRIKIRDVVLLRHGYDSVLHRPLILEPRDIRQFDADVSLIANYTPYKENILKALVAVMPDVDLKIWGSAWKGRCPAPSLKKYIQGHILLGESYAKAITATRINLGIMGGVFRGASQADETTTRSFEIPACGGFMLHERTPSILEIYEEGKEIACFGSAQELAEKITHYLAHPAEREAIAAAGHARCVPAYSYDHRMQEILEWHQSHSGASQRAGV